MKTSGIKSVAAIMAVASGLAGLLLGCAGCSSVEERVAERRASMERYGPELSIDPRTLPEVQLDWDTA
ncbi:MAG: hypothetical protein KJN98_05500, partial [Pontiella sp.]|nr:hypothetical protein [Pontiella sp.]